MVGNTHPSTPLFRTGRHRKFTLFLGVAFLIVAAVLTKHHSVSWNDNSRIATIDALSAHHTFAIDNEPAFPTGDKYRYGGKFYSDKPPELAIDGAVVALVLQRAGVSLERQPGLSYYLITLLLVGVAYPSGLIALYETLRIFSAGVLWSACITVVAGTATFLLPYATIFNNHVISGALTAIGFRLLVDPRFSGWTIARGAGAMALAASLDITFLIFVVLAPLLLLRHGLRRTIVPFVATFAPFGAIYFALNLALSGSVIPPALNLRLWNYPGSAFNSDNLTGLAVHRSLADHASYAVDLLVGNHGLFAYMPILIVSVYGLVRGWQHRSRYRAELAFVAVGCTLYVASYVWSSNDYSGYAYGIRWYAGIVYLAMIPLAFAEDAIVRSHLVRTLFIGTTFVSSIFAVVGLADPATPNNVGIPPFLFNARELFGHQHLAKEALIALFVLVTAALVIRLIALVQRAQTLRA